jgi:hypothetical protein
MKLNLSSVPRQLHLTTRPTTFESTCTCIKVFAFFTLLNVLNILDWLCATSSPKLEKGMEGCWLIVDSAHECLEWDAGMSRGGKDSVAVDKGCEKREEAHTGCCHSDADSVPCSRKA